MARDSQAALVALNRFGFGARGGASGDFVNAASDPRGFVKAELGRPNGVLLEVPGLQSTPALGQAVFDYQFEVKQARDGGEGRRTDAETPLPPDDRGQGAAAQSVARRARDADGAEGTRQARRKEPKDAATSNANAAMKPAEAMQPDCRKAAAAAAQRHPENLSRRGAGAAAARA